MEQTFPCDVVIKPRIQILVHPTGAFDRNEIVEAQACLLDFGSDLLWAMEVGRGEPLRAVRRILVDPVRQIAIHDSGERGIPERALLDAVIGGSETGDIRCEKQPIRDENSSRLAECSDAIAPVGQMIKRTKQQNHVKGRVRHMKPSRVPDVGTYQWRVRRSRQRPRSLHVSWDRINEMHLVTAIGQRERVDASSATNIKQARWRWRQMPLQDLPRPGPLEAAKRGLQPPLFFSVAVVVEDFRSDHCG